MGFILFYILYIIWWLFALIPLKFLYFLSDLSFPLIYYIICYRKKTVLTNLKKSFPEKDEKEIRIISKKFYHHFTDILIESIKMIHLSRKQLEKRIKIRNPEILQDLFNRKKSAIAVIGHYNNWEWILGIGSYIPHHTMAIYKPLNNKRMNDFMVKMRSKYGTEIISMRQTLKTMLKYKKENLLTVSGFISDQSPVWEETQYWTQFMNQLTPVYLGIEKMAKKTDQAIVFFYVHKIRRGIYEVEIIKLVDNVKDTQLTEITEKHIQTLEEIIRKQPEYWLWTHRRWKLTPRKLEEMEENQ